MHTLMSSIHSFHFITLLQQKKNSDIYHVTQNQLQTVFTVKIVIVISYERNRYVRYIPRESNRRVEFLAKMILQNDEALHIFE